LAFEAMTDMGANTHLPDRWRDRFDAEGYPLPGVAREFLSDYMRTFIHYRRGYHEFSCHRQRIQEGHIMDFPIEHPLAVDYWTIYITRGGQALLEVDSERLIVEPGSLLVMSPGQKATVMRAPDCAQWEHDHLSFRSLPHWLELLDWTFSLASPQPVYIRDPTHWELIQDVIDQLEQTTYRTGDWTERLCHNLIENLLIRLRLSRESESEGDHIDERLAAVVNHLLVHYQQRETLSDIARLARLSPGRLNALFRQQFGTSVMKWRDGLRLQKARELLIGTQLAVAEVADQVGFDDPLYFSRRFRHAFNQSPRAARRQGRA
jgi:AraC family transcriptional regulator of arabinose operon